MNESTLVPREEMSDLDWLARNVHVWREGANYVCVNHTDGGYVFHEHNRNCAIWFTKDQWLSRRAELQNKPSWNDAPEWAEFLSQSISGVWHYHEFKPDNGTRGYFSVKGKYMNQCSGEVLGDWRDTLEKRPADLSEQAVTARLKEATDNVLAAAPELMTDKYKFEPFVSVEDAATAKQPAPKGSGNPILGMVLADLTNRALEGKEKYGEPLLAHNGRNPLWDAYQEALDLAMYLRQAIEEQK